MAGDRTEAPTPRRKREARKKGQIARSPEIAAWIELYVASLLVPVVLARTTRGLLGLFGHVEGVGVNSEGEDAVRALGAGLVVTATAVLPLLLATVATALVAGLAQTRLFFSAHLLAPQLKRLNPVKGLKQLFSAENLWNLAKAFLKLAVITLVVWGPVHDLVRLLAASARPGLLSSFGLVGRLAVDLFRRVALAGLVLAAFDYGIAVRRTRKQLRMTKQEVKEEHRTQEGDPHVRGAIRRRQLEMSRNRMITAVADASVVVVNPTHVAVALRYEPSRGAPRVVAKGKGPIAARIRAEAERHDVPVVRDVPLARALHDACELGDEIPAALYRAVARVLAFVFSVRGTRPVFGGVLTMPDAPAARL